MQEEFQKIFKEYSSSTVLQKNIIAIQPFSNIGLSSKSVEVNKHKTIFDLKTIIGNYSIYQNGKKEYKFGLYKELDYVKDENEILDYQYIYRFEPIFNGIIHVNSIGTYDEKISKLIPETVFFKLTCVSENNRFVVVDLLNNFDKALRKYGIAITNEDIIHLKKYCLSNEVRRIIQKNIFEPKILVCDNGNNTYLNLDIDNTVTPYDVKNVSISVLNNLNSSQLKSPKEKMELLINFIQGYDKETCFIPYLYLGWFQNSFLAFQNRYELGFQPYLYAKGKTQSGKSSLFNMISSFYGLPSCLSSKEVSSDFRTLVLFSNGWVNGISEVEGLFNGNKGTDIIETLKSVRSDVRGRGTGQKNLERLESLNFSSLAFFSNENVSNTQLSNLLNGCVNLDIQTKHVWNKEHIKNAWRDCENELKGSYELGYNFLKELEGINLREYRNEIREYSDLISREINNYDRVSLMKTSNIRFKLEVSEREALSYAFVFHGLKTIYSALKKNEVVNPIVKETGHKLLFDQFFDVSLKDGINKFVEAVIVPSRSWDYTNVAKSFGNFLNEAYSDYQSGIRISNSGEHEYVQKSEKRIKLENGTDGILIYEDSDYGLTFLINRHGFLKFREYCIKSKVQLTDDFSNFGVNLTNELNDEFKPSARTKDNLKNKELFYKQRCYQLTFKQVTELSVGREEVDQTLGDLKTIKDEIK